MVNASYQIMNMRPRFREWLPLRTQQLRLRNLMRIQGINIECVIPNSSIYFTLHSSKESSAFYISEKLPQNGRQQNWSEITCSDMLKSNSNCVCVKVWASLSNVLNEFETLELLQTVSPIEKSSEENTVPPDKLLFTWGVYFSGLILLLQQPETKYLSNSLIFLLNGAYFTSPGYFTTDNLRNQITLYCQRYSSNLSKNCNEFNSIVQLGLNFNSSVVHFDDDLLQIVAARYETLHCISNDVRSSYDLNKLLRIQELQRFQLQMKKDIAQISDEIKQVSVHCISKEQLFRKSRSTSFSSAASHPHSMGRALSILLSEQTQINPKTLLQIQELQALLEILRFKQRLLQVEQVIYSKRILQLQNRLICLKESREQLEKSIQAHIQKLRYDKKRVENCCQEYVIYRERKKQMMQTIERRMATLCIELRQIYPIFRNKQGSPTICGIPLPNMNAYGNESRLIHGVNMECVSPMALSASLGYIAHLVQMIAVIINRPLRNPIIHEGSRSRILDTVKEIPYISRAFPLYSRSTIPSKSVKYAVYLLSQNIAQLSYDMTGVRCDVREMIENISHIFSILKDIEESQSGFYSAKQAHQKNRLALSNNANSSRSRSGCLSTSHSSVDIHHLFVTPQQNCHFLQVSSSQPVPITAVSSSQQRICRSVGSYSDCEDDFKDISNYCYSNSDSHINIKFKRYHD